MKLRSVFDGVAAIDHPIKFQLCDRIRALARCRARRRARRERMIREKVARLQLKKLSAELTVLTDRQARYIGVEQAGPYKTDQYR